MDAFQNFQGWHFLMHELAIMRAESYALLLFEKCPNKFSKHLRGTHVSVDKILEHNFPAQVAHFLP
jgi:hypothetical protein